MATIALCVICKNEKDNFPKFLESVRDCFDEIHVTDTGSTDGTIELLKSYELENPANTTLFLHHFPWINDFAAARNNSFSYSKADYVMWMDLDDVLENRNEFIEWRDTIMTTSDFWVATYHYGGIDEKGNSPCRFIRERVVRNNGNFEWKFFVHEGLVPKSSIMANYAISWSVNHRRTVEDQKKDRSRNLEIFQSRNEELSARMRYYYGKELFENGQPIQAYTELVTASKSKDLEPHDRIMAIQYACASAMQCNQFPEAIKLAHAGLMESPNRSEFHIFIADSLVRMGKLKEAIPFFQAAKSCQSNIPLNRADVIFSAADASGHYPRNQLARCYFHTNQPDEAHKVIEEAMSLGPNMESVQLYEEIQRFKKANVIKPESEYLKTDEIVITCIPNVVKDWDEDSLKTRGLGGSETAVIHMARHLHNKTGRKVRIFLDRNGISEKEGVSYEPISEMYAHFQTHMPALHIAWRHNVKLTAAPTYLWCHDLGYLGVENPPAFDGILALSEFHKNWLHHIYDVPKEKIYLTGNGIEPSRFKIEGEEFDKNPNKIVYSSSPDRGLEQVIAVMDEVIKEMPDAELHVFYGFQNMRAMGQNEMADTFEKMLASRSYIRNRGNIPQAELTQEFESAAIWLYPTTFLETYCITAIEALCSGVYPIVRKFGALPDTLSMASAAGMCDILDTLDPVEFARSVVGAIKEEKWRRVRVNPKAYSWENVAEDWIRLLPPLQ